jgi:hypothetical protein
MATANHLGIISAKLNYGASLLRFTEMTKFVILPAPASPEMVAPVSKKRLNRQEKIEQEEKNVFAVAEIQETFRIEHIERRLRMEGLGYEKPWSRNETAEDAAKRAEMRIERAKTAWWAAEQFQGKTFYALLALDASSRNRLQPKRPEIKFLIPHNRMGRLKKGTRVHSSKLTKMVTAGVAKDVPAYLNSIPLPKRKGIMFRNVTIRDAVITGWICQLGHFDAGDTWRAMLDAVNLAEAENRNAETLALGFNKGGNRVESDEGDRRMPVRETDLIPAIVQTKLSMGDVIDLEKILLDLLTEAGATEDLTTVQEAAIQQSETFTHSEANEMVPWEIARHIRSAPQTLQDAQTTLQRFPDLTSDDRNEQNALFRLANWVEDQESVQSRMRFYGRAEDPDFKERTFAPTRERFVPQLPGFSGFTAILGDNVSDVAPKDQWKLLRTVEAHLAPLFDPEERYVTTATPGVGSVAALLAKKNKCGRQVVNIDANFDESFRSYQKLALKGLDIAPDFVPAEYEGVGLVAMMHASRVVIVTGSACDTPVHHHGRVTLLPKKYAAALSEAVHFRSSNPEITVIAL